MLTYILWHLEEKYTKEQSQDNEERTPHSVTVLPAMEERNSACKKSEDEIQSKHWNWIMGLYNIVEDEKTRKDNLWVLNM